MARLLRAMGATVAVAESATGGLVSSRLTDVSGASDFVSLNVVTYSERQKVSVLGVRPETIAAHTVTSAEVALEMTHGLKKLMGSTGADAGLGAGADTGGEVGNEPKGGHFLLALTGIAGPGGGTEQHPVGTVFISIAPPSGNAQVFHIVEPQGLTREELKREFSERALELLRMALCKVPASRL